ncbi:X-Pro dipeptidyl-peptidase-domain-containing protein [Paraphoma chrysanthemicola]|uniref:X-Pro dipeptidyl-peptidase-domain-containing protein n=1 Tax=Paraphoma chrysanthemicola TaxID=798071 RepID=A0A8K0R8Q3_9PLEO|nr:X-Pro dipeptidyl-peptidase-domain-containing protein [Paraphoma chrysanthemicola]
MSTKRGFVTGLVDRLATRKLGFPQETCSYIVNTVRIPVSTLSESFDLVADLYQPILPKGQKPAGTILIRSPYGRGLAFALLSARPYASRGYVCLLVSCRGTFGSAGVFDPWRNEEEDGHAVVAWMRKQEWYTGSFATLGGSYLGFVQWALLRNPPPDMAAAVIHCAPHDFSKQLWGTGSLALEWITWGETISIQEKTGLVNTYHSLNTPKRVRPVLDRLPLAGSVKSHFNGRAPWLDFVVDNPDLSHPRYEQMNFTEALEKANIPIFLVGGWYDVFAQQTIEQFTRLSERNTNVALTIGPWNHMQVGLDSKIYQQSFEWLEEHLAKRKLNTRKSPLQYFVTGAQDWRESQTWPPQTSQQVYYLKSGNRLDTSEPSTQSTSLSTFTFDPQQPTPTMGGNLLLGGGSADDTTLATRSDVQTFTTSPLDQNMEVIGKITVDLAHSSDKSNVDLFVRISEVNAKGRSHGITDTYMRLQPERSDDIVRLELRDCAHRFSKGNQIRLIVAGASHPQFARCEEKAVHTIHHGDTGISKVVLPVAN